jgi:hypothetical protein
MSLSSHSSVKMLKYNAVQAGVSVFGWPRWEGREPRRPDALFWLDRVTAYSPPYKGLPQPANAASIQSPPSIRFRTRIDPSSPQTLDRELVAMTRLVVVRVLRRRRWKLAEGGAGAGSSSPWSVWTSSPEHPGSVLRLRQAPDLLPPRPRPLKQPPLLRRDVLLLSTEWALFVYFLIRSNVGSTTGSRGFFLYPRSVVFVFAQVCVQIRSTPSLSLHL